MILYHQSLPDFTWLACYCWWYRNDNSLGFIFFCVNIVAVLKVVVPTSEHNTLFYLLLSFKLAPLWASGTPRMLRNSRNSELYGTEDNLERECYWTVFSCNRDGVASLNVVVPTSEYYALLDLLLSFNLSSLWDSRHLRMLRQRRNSELYGKWYDL